MLCLKLENFRHSRFSQFYSITGPKWNFTSVQKFQIIEKHSTVCNPNTSYFETLTFASTNKYIHGLYSVNCTLYISKSIHQLISVIRFELKIPFVFKLQANTWDTMRESSMGPACNAYTMLHLSDHHLS